MKSDYGSEDYGRQLEETRKDIDSIDRQLIALLSRRQDAAKKVGEIKKKAGLTILDPAREQEVVRRLISESSENLSADAVRHIFKEIISASRSVQEALSVAFLGPEATFSHQAALSLCGHSASFRTAETIEDVFSMVEKGICDQGVVPIENSYEGSVNNTLDLLYNYDLKIGAEIFLRIRHHLLSRADDISKIKYLYSHPMPIAQCRSWLKTHLPGMPIKEVASTSLAAKLAKEDPESGAIGSRLSADTYGLNKLRENIEDRPDNVTRFLSIGKTQAALTGNDKTSILFFVQHKPGSLFRALEGLAARKINMNRIESRPMKIRNWEYLFFVDLEGHEQDSNVRDAIKEMEGACAFMKRLGSYPAAGDPWD
ncbi:MAG: prephenate dehydratase [Desulfatiglans sp.]|nr:prephenate dehydratase [Thermodesulfobacteriota bacterium]MEE4353031.1 prephenate dehydratase [Desulfatiglans sp.]